MPAGIGAWIGVGAALLLGAPGLAQAGGPIVAVIPEPGTVAQPVGQSPLRVMDGMRIIADPRDRDAEMAAHELAGLARQSRGLSLTLGGHGSGPAIRLIRSKGVASEAYSLKIGPGGVSIEASDGAGLLYGAVTLWQLMTTDGGQGPVSLAPVAIDDGPRFRWRGLMLDSARHFQSPAEIRRLIDWMAVHKLNVLHWHLTDDQGWRLQIAKYPRLTEVGAWRTPPEGSPDRVVDPATGRPRPYGGFYTPADAREIVAYAGARHVMVVPEIEMPGHALSALLAYPEFGAGAAPQVQDQTKWGGFPYVFDVNDRTYGFLEDVLTEVMAIFPSPYVHVGGDEAQAERWNGSPEIQAKMAELKLADAPALQGAFTRRIAEFLKAHGRRLVGWDEILGGGLPGEAVVMSWHGAAGAASAAAAGHDAILAPAPTLYFDNWQAVGADQPPGRGYLVPLRDVYAFEPMPAGADAATAGHILGLEAALWSEHIRTFDELQAMAFPRAAALAEVGWSAPERRDWSSFLQRLPAEMDRYKALGLHADQVALAPEPSAGPDLRRRRSQELKLCNDKLALNLEGPGGRTYLTNPQEGCWIWPAAELDGVSRLEIGFTRLPFVFALDPAHNTVVVRPPRTLAGELEVRQDGCLSDPIAVAPVPPPGGRTSIALALPPRTGKHDLCVLFTSQTYDPILALDHIQLEPAGAP